MRSPVLFILVSSLILAPTTGLADLSDQPPKREKKESSKEPQLTKPPALIEFVEAAYPESLLQKGIGGEVLMVVDIDINGEVEQIEIIQFSNTEFVIPAMAAVAAFPAARVRRQQDQR